MVILLSQPTACWKYSGTSPCLASLLLLSSPGGDVCHRQSLGLDRQKEVKVGGAHISHHMPIVRTEAGEQAPQPSTPNPGTESLLVPVVITVVLYVS